MLLKILTQEKQQLYTLSRAQAKDCAWVSDKAQIQLEQAGQVLRLIDGSHPTWPLLTNETCSLNHEALSAFDLAYILTLFISAGTYSMIIVDGYLADLQEYLPRLRWVLSYYDCILVLLQD